MSNADQSSGRGTADAANDGSVLSVFGRVGDVAAQAGDYTASQISNFATEARNAIDGNAISPSSVSAEEADVTNETFIRGVRTSLSGSTSSDTFVDITNSEQVDSRGEFDGTTFTPDKDGRYDIIASASFSSGSAGDKTIIRLRDTTNGADISRQGTSPVDCSDFPSVLFIDCVQLTAGDSYKIQATNKNSSFGLNDDNDVNRLVIRRSVVAP